MDMFLITFIIFLVYIHILLIQELCGYCAGDYWRAVSYEYHNNDFQWSTFQ